MSLIELAKQIAEPKTAEVRIGAETYTVRGIVDPTKLLALQKEVQARSGVSVKIPGPEGKPVPVRLDENEVAAYLFLREGWAGEEAVTYEVIVAASRNSGFDCLHAGIKVMELSGISGDAVEDAKNGSGEEAAAP